MSVETPPPHAGGLRGAIAVGVLVGLVILASPVPSVRVGPAPVLASAIGTAAAIGVIDE